MGNTNKLFTHPMNKSNPLPTTSTSEPSISLALQNKLKGKETGLQFSCAYRWKVAHELKTEFLPLLPSIKQWEAEDLILCTLFITQLTSKSQPSSSGFNMLASSI